MTRWVGRAAVTAAVLAMSAGASSAAAHPFGDPQTVQLTAEESTVVVRWSAPADDLLVLGGLVGALPDRREIVFDVSPDAPPEPVGDTDADRLIASPDVAAYLAENVVVRQAGTPCPADVRLDGLIDDGAELVFTCRSHVEDVEIEVTTLTDVHEAYRTAALGDGSTTPGRALYTVDDTTVTWTFGTEQDGAPGAPVALWGAVGVAALAGALGTARTLRARSRRSDS
ncbi:hypothetical protein [Phytoactinopolyspora mesophila]|uniref:Uncharacterized protein n=1 Tax=Phytoactinopolyspora mesophila TaxID=2650750 RepID=A0A7K3LYT5_9ACTN|nr:hypothetical protein [Phytoactinopolyspora mesophila]NDL55852.1 hypothetical protein [Phytoactinopolyspora mesophila]